LTCFDQYHAHLQEVKFIITASHQKSKLRRPSSVSYLGDSDCSPSAMTEISHTLFQWLQELPHMGLFPSTAFPFCHP